MKCISVFVFMAFMINPVFGQDKIYQILEASPLEVKILEVNPEEIKYKKLNYLDGPTFILSKSDLIKIEYENGDIETFNKALQESQKLLPTSRIYVEYEEVKNKNNVNSADAQRMAGNILRDFIQCEIVNHSAEGDFILKLRVTKAFLGDRKAQADIIHQKTGKRIYKSRWYKGSPNEFNGYSGTRASIRKIVKRGILNEFPDISLK